MSESWGEDRSWAEKEVPTHLQIALCTFGILGLELALIRWLPSQVRIFAYFNNLTLICAFLGMGLGVALGKRRPGLVHAVLPLLAIYSLILGSSTQLGLDILSFPDPSVYLWGTTGMRAGFSILAFLSLLLGCIVIFATAGAPLGYLFTKEKTLRAYSWDLGGSLAGVLCMTASTALHSPPPVWLALGALPFLILSRRLLSALSLGVIILAATVSIQGARYSAYNRIELTSHGASLMLSVNCDFHQFIHDLSDSSVSQPNDLGRQLALCRRAYDIPFVIGKSNKNCLVVGAGTGNDVQAALRNGCGHVTSVDIDGVILEIGKKVHPEHPYSDPRAQPVENDARAFLSQYRGEPFDVICYGLLDSHAMFAAMSSLRLDNYVYTREAFQRSWQNLGPDGVMCVSFSIFGGEWLSDRLFWTLKEATGVTPVIVNHNMQLGRTYVVARHPENLKLEKTGFPILREPDQPREKVRITTDDWPFLYIRPGVFPWGYLFVLTGLVSFAAVATPLAYGRRTLGADFDAPLFLMGAAFLLLETRGITSLALLCGSTWIVNSAIFASVLLLVWIANLAVMKLELRNPKPWLLPLLASVILVWLFEPNSLVAFSLPVRAMLGGLVLALPIGIAGVIVSCLLNRSAKPSASLGSNLLGSVLGGCLEYSSMIFGLKWLALLALALYLAAAALIARKNFES
ncbi:MAG: hypothetical protein J0I12_24280 [Candidatus Eremiobacteraeota bacterium]|nr:hypothetical protein [Candidatus Eremiobacteraeota bacterium]